VVLLLLIPYWLDRPKLNALGNYLTDRLNLAINLQRLDDDPMWQRYKDSHATAESTSISQLIEDPFEVSGSGTEIGDVKPSKDTPRRGKTHPSRLPSPGPSRQGVTGGSSPKKFPSRETGVPVPVGPPSGTPNAPKPAPPGVVGAAARAPSPPTNLKIVVPGGGAVVIELSDLASFLTKLNDPEMLSRSFQVSNYFNTSIARWLTKRNSLVYRNAVLRSCATKDLETPHQGKPSPYIVPALYGDVLLKCLTLEDIRELASFELPTAVYNPPQFGEHIGAQIDINPGTLPRNPYFASILTQVLLFFVITYFSAFAREAASTTSFPSRGTLFGAFCGTRLTLLVFIVALWSPFVASLSVAVTSRQWPMFLCSVFIFCAVLSAYRVLQQRSYWAPLISGSKLTPAQSSAPLLPPEPDSSG
jgi:hypothetical protein